MPQKNFEDLKESYKLRIKEPLDKMFFATKQDLINFANQVSAGINFNQIPHLASVYQDFIVDWDMFVQDADYEAFQCLVVSEVHAWVYRNVISLQGDQEAFEHCWREQYVRNQPNVETTHPVLPKPIMFTSDQHKVMMELLKDPFACVSFATKAPELAICLPIGQEIAKLRAAIIAGDGVDKVVFANSVQIIYKILKDTLNLYNASEFYLVGDVKDLLLKLSHVLHVFNGSRITIEKFKGYSNGIKDALLSDPHFALELIDRMDEVTFDHYLEIYQLIKSANFIIDCEYPDLLQETMTRVWNGAKTFIQDRIGLNHGFDESNPADLMIELYHLYFIYTRVFKEFYIEDSILNQQTYVSLEKMSTHQKGLKDLASVNNGDVKILANLDVELLASIFADCEDIIFVCRELSVDLNTFLSIPEPTLKFLLQEPSRMHTLILLHKYYAFPIEDLFQLDIEAITIYINKPSEAVNLFNSRAEMLNVSALDATLQAYLQKQAYTLQKFIRTQSVMYLGELYDNLKRIIPELIAAGLDFVQYRAILERCVAQIFQFNGIYLDAYRCASANKIKDLKLDRTAIHARFNSAHEKIINTILDSLHLELQKALDLRELERDEDYTLISQSSFENLLADPQRITCFELRYIRKFNTIDDNLEEKFFDAVNCVTNTHTWFSSSYTGYGDDLMTKTIYSGNASALRELLSNPTAEVVGYNRKMYSYFACTLYSENQVMINNMINSIMHKTENSLRAFINTKLILVDIQNLANNSNSTKILNAAIKDGRLDIVEALLVRGVSPTASAPNGVTPLQAAKLGGGEIHAVIMNDLLICAELYVPEIKKKKACNLTNI